MSTFIHAQNNIGRGAARLNVTERAALRGYLGRLGYREAVRTLGVGRSTLTVACLGGTMRNATAFLLRSALAAQVQRAPDSAVQP